MTRTTAFLTTGLLALVLLPGLATPQEAGTPPVDPQKMMELWQKHRTPVEQHKALGWFVGTWDTETVGEMMPAPEKGVAEFKWLIEGLWLSQEIKGALMGQPFHGFAISGYDIFKKKHVSSWCDNLGTAMLRMEGGPVDPEGRIHVEWGVMDEYMTGEHDRAFRGVTQRVDDDTFTFQLWDMGIGIPGKPMMTVTYKRRKAK